MITLAITDDHELVRRGIHEMMSASTSMHVVAMWSSAAETIAGLSETQPQVLLLDIHLPDSSGNTLCLRVKKMFPKVEVVCISYSDHQIIVNDMLEAGAKGFLTKDAGRSEIEAAVGAVLRGEVYLSKKLDDRQKKQDMQPNSVRLTRREEHVLRLVAMEHTTAQIAAALFISEKTVEAHRANLCQKLGVKNVAGLVREAILRGLVE